MTSSTKTPVEKLRERIARELADEIDAIGLDVATSYTLADAIREGSTVTRQPVGWGSGDNACAMSAAVIAGRARGYIK